MNLALLLVYFALLIIYFTYRETNLPNIRGPGFLSYVQQLDIEAQHFSVTMNGDDKSLTPNGDLYDPFPQLLAFTQSPLDLIQAARKYEKSCDIRDLESASAVASAHSMNPSKLLEWHKMICTGELEKFVLWLDRSPLLHPNGSSYAKLYYDKARTPKENIDESLLHLSEKNNLTEFDKWFLKLSLDNQKKYVQGFTALTVASRLVIPGEWNGTARKISVYPLSAINEELRKTYSLETVQVEKSSLCEYSLYGLCFYKKSGGLPLKFQWSLPLLYSLLAYFVMAILISYWVWYTEQSHKNENQALLFQVISHEIRTPLTSLKLSSDGLRQHFDLLTPNNQIHLMNLLDSLYDLEKIVGKTLRELKGENLSTPQDIVQLTEGIIQSKYRDLVNFKSEISECYVDLSVFWFEICLTNLIRNALSYGKQPIDVTVKKESHNVVSVTVEDRGEASLKFLRSLLNPIFKVKSTKGLGIGLKIVARKMKESGGSLEVRALPTRFILKFKCKETA